MIPLPSPPRATVTPIRHCDVYLLVTPPCAARGDRFAYLHARADDPVVHPATSRDTCDITAIAWLDLDISRITLPDNAFGTQGGVTRVEQCRPIPIPSPKAPCPQHNSSL